MVTEEKELVRLLTKGKVGKFKGPLIAYIRSTKDVSEKSLDLVCLLTRGANDILNGHSRPLPKILERVLGYNIEGIRMAKDGLATGEDNDLENKISYFQSRASKAANRLSEIASNPEKQIYWKEITYKHRRDNADSKTKNEVLRSCHLYHIAAISADELWNKTGELFWALAYYECSKLSVKKGQSGYVRKLFSLGEATNILSKLLYRKWDKEEMQKVKIQIAKGMYLFAEQRDDAKSKKAWERAFVELEGGFDYKAKMTLLKECYGAYHESSELFEENEPNLAADVAFGSAKAALKLAILYSAKNEKKAARSWAKKSSSGYTHFLDYSNGHPNVKNLDAIQIANVDLLRLVRITRS
jgi:hypothetical protein